MPRTVREHLLTPLDLALLEAISAEGSLVGACRSLGVRRDRGNYRLRRLSQLAGGPVTLASRGGHPQGKTRLTPLGRSLLRRGTGPLGQQPDGARRMDRAVLRGTWHRHPEPHVDLSGGGPPWFVGFQAAEGEAVRVTVDPETILISQRRFPTSARNVLTGRVARVDDAPGGQCRVRVRVGRMEIPVAVTPASVRRLGLRRGASAVLYVKATAVHRV